MRIYIPTTGRADRQKTATRLADAGIDFTLVVPSTELDEYAAQRWRVLACPAKGICATRNWILAQPPGEIVMVDDDLEFYSRTKDNRWPRASNEHVAALFAMIGLMLETHAHGGVCEKFMSQNRPRKVQFNKRYFHILCYNTKLFPRPWPTYRTETGEDHDMNLQLLKAGRPNFLLTEWAHADRPWAEGGCNTWRTPKLNEKACRDLARLHPDVIKLMPAKKNMEHHGNTPFTMRINWRQAAKVGGCVT